MADIVNIPDPDRRAQFRLIVQQRKALLRAFDRIETTERRAKAVETCVMLSILDRCQRAEEGE